MLFNEEVAKGFTYSGAPQKSPEWRATQASRIGASEIGTHMAKGVKGQYLAGRKGSAISRRGPAKRATISEDYMASDEFDAEVRKYMKEEDL